MSSSLLFMIIVLANSICSDAQFRTYEFEVREANYTRLCETKTILTVNGMFPGPTIEVEKGETIYVDVYNRGGHNITLHWHGVRQPRYPWSDGPEYITQCPIQPGGRFRQKVIFSKEEGTLWWHAHSDWARATVHGPIIIRPKNGTRYPFAQPAAEILVVLGEWWKEDILTVLEEFVASGGQPADSDAYTINGQPGALYSCSENDTFTAEVQHNRTYLVRIINADMNEILFFGVAKHDLTVVATDACYTKPFTSPYVVISPGQTLDCLLTADQTPASYFMATAPYVSGFAVNFGNSSATAILRYANTSAAVTIPTELPPLPSYNDTAAAANFSYSLRGLNTVDHPTDVPLKIRKRIISTISINARPCPSNATANATCQGPNGTRLAASMNNISFVNPSIDILEAYFYQVPGVFGKRFPNTPPFEFNYTADVLPLVLQIPRNGTQAKVLRYNTTVEIVFQGTNLVSGIDHPMHLHGYSFHVVGWGFGNFDEENDPKNYNLVDPQNRNTIIVPKNGWAAIRFRADNPGVWFMHCHYERHLTWGMNTVFIVRSGRGATERVLPPPEDMPPC